MKKTKKKKKDCCSEIALLHEVKNMSTGLKERIYDKGNLHMYGCKFVYCPFCGVKL